MSHFADEIADLEARLAALKARAAAEDAERARAEAARPAGIPANWLPAIVQTNGTFTTAAWYDPNFTVTALHRVRP